MTTSAKAPDMPGKFLRRFFLWLGLSFGCALIGYFAWKAWPVGRDIYRVFADVAARKSLPDPVVVQDGVYWFPLGKRVYAVPKTYVRSYGRNSTDGKLSSFSLHALLPDFVGYSPETAAGFKTPGWGDRIEIMVSSSRTKSREEVEKFYYEYYLRDKESIKRKYGRDPIVVSEYPHVEIVGPVLGNDEFFLIENQRTKKKLHCTIKEKSYQLPSCKDISMFYRDNIRLYVTYSRSFEKDWIAIEDRLVSWLDSFERPAEDFPRPARLEHEL
jgi:hypothetical protein